MPAILSQRGRKLVVHTVVTGGQALLDTLHGAAQLVSNWTRTFRSLAQSVLGGLADDGKSFEQMKIYQDIKKGVGAIDTFRCAAQ